MRISKFLPALIVAVSIVSVGTAQEIKTPVTIAVRDASGAIVLHAQVRVGAESATSANLQTDAEGKVHVSLLPGSYSLSVTSRGFSELRSQIEVQPAANGQTITVTLVAESLVNVVISSPDLLESLLLYYPPDKKISIGTDDIKALPHISVTIHNPHSNADETYAGVRLSDLLAKIGAPLGPELRGAALADYLVATGSDGYRAVFSLAEIDPSFHPGEILVADTMNSARLGTKTGPLRLVVSEDKRPARSVRNLITIELKSANQK